MRLFGFYVVAVAAIQIPYWQNHMDEFSTQKKSRLFLSQSCVTYGKAVENSIHSCRVSHATVQLFVSPTRTHTFIFVTSFRVHFLLDKFQIENS